MSDTHPTRAEKPAHSTHKTQEYLNRAFQESTRGLPMAQVIRWKDPTDREIEGQRHYKWQVDMAYFLHDIANSPQYAAPKLVADCNKLIADIKTYRAG